MAGRDYSLDAPRDSFARGRVALLGMWLGALAAFGALFVPAAFEHLPTQLAAGVLGDGFAALDRGGALVGAVCVALGLASARPRRGAALWRALVPAVGVAAHVASAAAVAPHLHALRVAAGGTIGQLAPGDPELAEFARLHAVSRALFTTAAASAALACVWDVLSAPLRPSAGFSRR
ncbi:MAG TPA: DUF4149 domain-containing protein [Myxococcota bacterium]|jgi:hypothetical protein|nr:DUF4149 domain-containing protein [Myxococcota bacterium]